MTARPGRLIALEGIDGCGKTTQARRLASALGAISTHEPGATALGQTLRRMVLGTGSGSCSGSASDLAGGGDRDGGSAHPHPVLRAEALLLAADKAQHVTAIVRPALEAGRWVVTDRFVASTLAYQGYGRGLPTDVLRALLTWAVDGLVPDLTILVDVPVDLARSRITASPDRLERMDDGFFTRVRDGYLQMAQEDPTHWAVVDGSAPEDTVATCVAGAVRERLGDLPPPGARQAAAPCR